MAVRHARRNRPSATVGENRMEAIRRHEQFWEELEKQNKITKIIRKYDLSKDGKLNKEELGNMLQDLAGGEKPTEEEVVYVLKTADLIDKKIDDHIGPEELETAIDIWHRYLNSKPEIARIFDKYDKNQSGQLEFDELKALLQELNDGKEPEDNEVGGSQGFFLPARASA
uniref:EF-hand domain-containing protein n=1 Tax=Guillardia theta TaxID=55529 RepID=A0A7S4JRD4_GUITH